MIFSEKRFPPRIKSRRAFSGSCFGGRSHALFTEAKARHPRENHRKRPAALQPKGIFRCVYRRDHERRRPHPWWHFAGKEELYAAAVRQFLCKKAPAAWQKRREPSAVTKHRAQRIVDAYFSREHFDDHEGCCPLLGTASDVERCGEPVKTAYQEVVEQLVKVFEDHLGEPQARERALALVALCVGGMVLARNVGDPGLADDFRRSAHAEVLRTAGWT
jgi:TetR/AcrR family transcriptional regulator, transcriptional repressor for nem operon